MKYVFDWQAFGGCLLILLLLPVAGAVVFGLYFLFHVILYFLPVIGILFFGIGILYLLWCGFKGLFLKKVE